SASSATVASGGGELAGSSPSTSVTTRTVRPPVRALPMISCSRCDAVPASSAAIPGPDSSTVFAPTAAAALRASVSLPTPSGPMRRTPRRGVPPRRVSRSGRSNVSSSHSTSLRAAPVLPTSSSIGGGAGSVGSPEVAAGGGAGAVALLVAGAGAPVSVAPVSGPPSQPTTVLGFTATAPAGSTEATVSSSVVHALPSAPETRCRAAEAFEPGAGTTSWGSSDTASPAVTTLPTSASRIVSGVSAARASRDPVSVTRRAGCTVAGATTTGEPSVRPALDRVTSSSVAWPAGPVPGATIAVVTRAPVKVTASHERSPSASMISGCSRTTPRRASAADAASRATRVMEAATPQTLSGRGSPPAAPLTRRRHSLRGWIRAGTGADAEVTAACGRQARGMDSSTESTPRITVDGDPVIGAAPTYDVPPQAGPAPEPAKPKFRLRRSRNDRMIAGVCGGLAESLGVDAAIIRIGLVTVTVLGFGMGIVLYAAVWALAPETDEP